MILKQSVVALGLAAALTMYGQTGADNTKQNKRDRKTGAVTAEDQKNNASDLEITKQIRKAVMADKSLSTYAHNVKIVSQNGMVTLKGPVKSAVEKTSVKEKAVQVVGDAAKVTDEITIAK